MSKVQTLVQSFTSSDHSVFQAIETIHTKQSIHTVLHNMRDYKLLSEKLLLSLQAFHWDNVSNTFYDVGLYDSEQSGTFIVCALI